MKLAPFLLLVLTCAGCAGTKPFQPGDTLVSAKDGTELGKVIGLGYHNFENGASGESVHVMLSSGKDAWYSLDTTIGSYIAKK
jgi:hypothetical protein